MVEIFKDTFIGGSYVAGELASHTSDSGHTWLSAPGSETNGLTYTALSDGLYVSGVNHIFIISPNIVVPDDFEVEIKFVRNSEFLDFIFYFDHSETDYSRPYPGAVSDNWVGFGNNYTTNGLESVNSLNQWEPASPAVSYPLLENTVLIRRTGSTGSIYVNGVLRQTRGGMGASLGSQVSISFDPGTNASPPNAYISSFIINSLAPTPVLPFWTNYNGQTETGQTV